MTTPATLPLFGWRPALERLERLVSPEPNTGCWLWTGKVDRDGYGDVTLSRGGRRWSVRSHRLSWLLYRGELEPSAFVCHRCDTPGCVNPEHLFLGTATDNNRDMIRKGRRRLALGESHGSAKLTRDTVIAARLARSRGENMNEWARKLGVSPGTLHVALVGKTWGWVREGL